MPEKINATLVEKILISDFCPVKIKKEDGTFEDLSSAQVKKMIKDFVFGGKSPGQLEEQLIKEGISGDQWEKRKRIMKLFTDLLHDNISKGDRSKLHEALGDDEDENNQE